jgi:hypothetical protein
MQMSIETNIATAKNMINRAIKDGAYREKLSSNAAACFEAEGMVIPIESQESVQQLVMAQLAQFEFITQNSIAVRNSELDLTPLDSSKFLTERNSAKNSGNYVAVSAQPWGVVMTLSDQAVKDLQSGQAGIAGVLGAIAAAASLIPGGQIPAAFIGAAAGVIGVHSAVIGLVNRGKGVYLTWLWTTVVCHCTLALPLPTPVV